MNRSEAMEVLIAEKRARLARPPRKERWRFVQSLAGGWAHRRTFRHLETFCLFIGYPRSGHTLIGSLLDAHPQAIIADELDALRFVQAGFDRRQVFYLIMRNARNFAADGRERTGYVYAVPRQWQGRCENLRVVGDKFGGVTEMRLQLYPQLLESLGERLQLAIKFVHVVRNPYDIISTLHLRQQQTLESAVARFFILCEAVAYIKSRMPGQVLDVRHEEFLSDPKSMLARLCAFVDIEASEEYLEACASIVFRSPHQSRKDIVWPEDLVGRIAEAMTQFAFLDGYSFGS